MTIKKKKKKKLILFILMNFFLIINKNDYLNINIIFINELNFNMHIFLNNYNIFNIIVMLLSE